MTQRSLPKEYGLIVPSRNGFFDAEARAALFARLDAVLNHLAPGTGLLPLSDTEVEEISLRSNGAGLAFYFKVRP